MGPKGGRTLNNYGVRTETVTASKMCARRAVHVLQALDYISPNTWSVEQISAPLPGEVRFEVADCEHLAVRRTFFYQGPDYQVDGEMWKPLKRSDQKEWKDEGAYFDWTITKLHVIGGPAHGGSYHLWLHDPDSVRFLFAVAESK